MSGQHLQRLAADGPGGTQDDDAAHVILPATSMA